MADTTDVVALVWSIETVVAASVRSGTDWLVIAGLALAWFLLLEKRKQLKRHNARSRSHRRAESTRGGSIRRASPALEQSRLDEADSSPLDEPEDEYIVWRLSNGEPGPGSPPDGG